MLGAVRLRIFCGSFFDGINGKQTEFYGIGKAGFARRTEKDCKGEAGPNFQITKFGKGQWSYADNCVPKHARVKEFGT
jgi:hypothetical protein